MARRPSARTVARAAGTAIAGVAALGLLAVATAEPSPASVLALGGGSVAYALVSFAREPR